MNEPDTKRNKVSDDENIRKLASALGELKGLDRLHSYHLSGHENCAMKGSLSMIAGISDIYTRFSFYRDYKGLDFEVSLNFRSKQDGRSVIMFRHYIGNNEGINQDDILKFSTEVYEVIPKLKLDIDGQLRVPNMTKISINKSFHEVFSSMESADVKVHQIDKCPVCNDETETKTDCKHPLCYKCWSKMKSCPLCRAQLCPDYSDDE
jgi:hypothetical protein